MSSTTTEKFEFEQKEYSFWRSGYSPNIYVYNITADSFKSSSTYDINKVVKIDLSATGGWVYQCGADNGYGWINMGTSMRADLKLEVFGITASGTTSSSALKTVTGSANRGGDLSCYSVSTTETGTYTPSSSDKATYKYIQLKFTWTAADKPESATNCTNASDGWGSQSSPYGIATITLKSTIPVTYNGGDELQELHYGTTNITTLKYNGTVIYGTDISTDSGEVPIM